MKMRAPSVPLFNVDPYFSVWSPATCLTDRNTIHWTEKNNTILGKIYIDGKPYRFMGEGEEETLRQTVCKITAMATEYRFEGAGVELKAEFLSPRFLDDLYYLSRPTCTLALSFRSMDGKEHTVVANVAVSEEICLNYRGEDTVEVELPELAEIQMAKIGSTTQPVLKQTGDQVRINWGYFYIATDGVDAKTGCYTAEVPFAEGQTHGDHSEMTFVFAENTLKNDGSETLFVVAYDDVASILYWDQPLRSYWNRNGASIEEEIQKTFSDYAYCKMKSIAFDERLFVDATRAGGEKYAELLELAYRQVCAAHKLVLDKNGEVLFISKECGSGGFGATVDVSYPSSPMFLLYNPSLIRGMLRPILRYVRSGEWKYDFAPHDVGYYPHIRVQTYCDNLLEAQMPVEECGNMLIMFAAEAVASGDVRFCQENLDLLEQWVLYLEKYGRDPGQQLCTDDFTGHLAHNCNLALKAIMGIASLGIIYNKIGLTEKGKEKYALAHEMALDWEQRAANDDGSYRLAFDCPGTFSMKYNIVWDKVFGTCLMPNRMLQSEVASYRRREQTYGLPLDNRADYTKSDWLVWVASLADDQDTLEERVGRLWDAYNNSESRGPMTDWYRTRTADRMHFKHRSVQGGLFIKLLDASGKMRVK